MDKLSKPVFSDEEYKALCRLIKYLSVTTQLKEHSHWSDKKFNKDLETINGCLQASEYINENHIKES